MESLQDDISPMVFEDPNGKTLAALTNDWYRLSIPISAYWDVLLGNGEKELRSRKYSKYGDGSDRQTTGRRPMLVHR